MLVDSDVLIWYLRGEARAAEFLALIAQPRISAVSYMELARLKRDLELRRAAILPINEAISGRAVAPQAPRQVGDRAGLLLQRSQQLDALLRQQSQQIAGLLERDHLAPGHPLARVGAPRELAGPFEEFPDRLHLDLDLTHVRCSLKAQAIPSRRPPRSRRSSSP